jgi:Ca2+-transporting ATPase
VSEEATSGNDATTPWHAMPGDEVVQRLGTDASRGLDPAEAARRALHHGPNALAEVPGPTSLQRFLSQFRGPLVLLLAAALVVMLAMGDLIDAAAVSAILVLNAVLGWYQEGRASDALAALRRMAAPSARVVRGGATSVVASDRIVPGDLIAFEAGDRVPADVRLLRAEGVAADEALLSGESEPAQKHAHPPDTADAVVADRHTVLWSGTAVTAGAAHAVVVATGAHTEFGRIAGLVRSAETPETPLQARMKALGSLLAKATLAVVVLVFVLGILRGVPGTEMFLAAVTLAVAAVPEGLPAVVTVSMALGVRAMARRGALVRSLPAVETLGCASVIASDKTGTLTVGAMTLRVLHTAQGETTFTGEGYGPEGEVQRPAGAEASGEDLTGAALQAGVSCATARLVSAEQGAWTVAGDPTEGALLVAGKKDGIDPAALEEQHPPLRILPFDAVRRRMTVVRSDDGGVRASVKGAPESILPLCTRVLTSSGETALDEALRKTFEEENLALAARGLRVLALARRDLKSIDESPDDALEEDLVLLGLAGIVDPPRPGAKDAVAACREAGIRVLMVTGDHPATAMAIARELGIAGPEDVAVTGPDLDAMDDAALQKAIPGIAVCARVAPEHKLRIVRAWRALGAVVAVTGDGVNDAPALRGADIGVAMGRGGTEVAKEASAMVLTDDDFSTIVAAVAEGRRVYDNVRKTVMFLLGGNLAEILVMAVAVVAGWPLPLLPLHVLWVNLVTDGLPALALAADPADPDLLKHRPRPKSAGIVDGDFAYTVLASALLVAGCTLGAYLWMLWRGESVDVARSAAFTVLVVSEVMKAFAFRGRDRLLWEVGPLSNLSLALVAAVTLVMQWLLVSWEPVSRLLHLAPLASADLVVLGVLGFVPVSMLESMKLLRRVTGLSPSSSSGRIVTTS